MNLTLKVRIILLGTVAILLMPSAGCQSTEYDRNAADFDPERSRTRAILDAQYAKGAADDASVSRHHFQDGRLNGLGRDKIDRMLAAGRPHSELVVHIDVPDAGEMEQDMIASVRDYLAASGVAVAETMVVMGPSLVRSPSSNHLAGVGKLQNDQGAASVGSAGNDVMASQHAGVGGQ